MIDLVLFTVDPQQARTALAAGITTFIVDWEYREKETRQAGFDTEINMGTPDDLRRLAELGEGRRLCRLNASGPETPDEVETAIAAGATDILLPMIRTVAEVESFLEAIGARCGAGILVETREATGLAEELASLPLTMVYVGLNDLAISRGASTIFDAIVDGTVEKLRETFGEISFGFGGLTCVDTGRPIPCRLLLAEMVRIGADFSFLRRSFKRDIADRDWRTEIDRLRAEEDRLRRREPSEIVRDQVRFHSAVQAWGRAKS